MATRKEIRQAVAALIAPALDVVYSTWRDSPDPRDFPCGMVFFESGRPEAVHGGYETEADLSVEIWGLDADDLDGYLDGLGGQVKALIEADVTLGGLVDGLTLISFDYERFPDTFAGSLTLIFNCVYQDED